jgi:hypothetical protein
MEGIRRDRVIPREKETALENWKALTRRQQVWLLGRQAKAIDVAVRDVKAEDQTGETSEKAALRSIEERAGLPRDRLSSSRFRTHPLSPSEATSIETAMGFVAGSIQPYALAPEGLPHPDLESLALFEGRIQEDGTSVPKAACLPAMLDALDRSRASRISLSLATGIEYTTLSKMLKNDDRTLRSGSVRVLSHALSIPVETFGLKPHADAVASVQERHPIQEMPKAILEEDPAEPESEDPADMQHAAFHAIGTKTPSSEMVLYQRLKGGRTRLRLQGIMTRSRFFDVCESLSVSDPQTDGQDWNGIASIDYVGPDATADRGYASLIAPRQQQKPGLLRRLLLRR